MPPDSWEAEAVAKHIVHHRCFAEGVLGHGRLPSETGAAVQGFQINHWLRLVFNPDVTKIIVGFGVVFCPRLEYCQSQPYQFHCIWEEKQKAVLIFTDRESNLNLGMKSLVV